MAGRRKMNAGGDSEDLKFLYCYKEGWYGDMKTAVNTDPGEKKNRDQNNLNQNNRKQDNRNQNYHNRIYTLTGAAMLVAVGIVLGFLKIPITDLVEIRFGSLPIALAGVLFGPGTAAAVGAAADIGGYLVKPTGPFFPGFTISGALTGVIFGLLLYKKKVTLKRVLIAEAFHTLLIGMLLNTVWLSILYNWQFQAALAARVVKEAVMYPINTALLYSVLKSVSTVPAVAQFRGAEAK